MLVAEALSLAHHCLLGPQHTRERLALAEELISVSPRTGRALDGLMGLAWRTVDLVLAGDRRAPRSLAELRAGLDVDRCDGLRYLADALDVMFAVRDGRLAEAETLAAAAYELGLQVGDADALGWYGAQLISIRWLQGRADELLPMVEEIANSTTMAEPAAGFVAAVAALAAAAGQRPTAAAAMACLRAAGLGTVAPSSSWSATMLGICEAAHLLGDADAAAEAYSRLAPHADLPVMASLGVASFGSAHRPLGVAALTMGDLDRAASHLERAVAAELAIGDRPWHAVASATLAGVLDQRGHGDDRRRATELRADAVAAAEQMGMGRLAAMWREQGRLRRVRCRRHGRCWTVEMGSRTVTVPHCVGLDYLAQLVANPDVEIDAVALASGHTLTTRPATDSAVVDRRAIEHYRQRIAELHEEIDDAVAAADLARASRARLELDTLVDHLADSSGLRGTSRCFADGAERARISVLKALQRALRTIAVVDSVIGSELTACISTGYRCVYRPNQLAGRSDGAAGGLSRRGAGGASSDR